MHPKEEDPITEDSKQNPINEKLKEEPYYCETRRQRYQWRSSGASEQLFLAFW